MNSRLLCVTLLAGMSTMIAACAAPQPLDWSRPAAESSIKPILLHDMAIANPPYPGSYYPNYMDEPTRFEFHPRPPMPPPDEENPDEGGDTAAADGSYIENGILYVDPNQ
jgi:hypothetical protein